MRESSSLTTGEAHSCSLRCLICTILDNGIGPTKLLVMAPIEDHMTCALTYNLKLQQLQAFDILLKLTIA